MPERVERLQETPRAQRTAVSRLLAAAAADGCHVSTKDFIFTLQQRRVLTIRVGASSMNYIYLG